MWFKTLLHLGEDERILERLCMIVKYRTKGRIVCDNKRNATELVCGGLTGFMCFVACDSMNSLDFCF